MSTATIHVNRIDKEYVDRFRPRKVVIDGELVGSVRRGETLDFEVPAGKHDVCTKIDWCRSATVELELAEGEDVWLASRSRSLWQNIYWITLGHRRYSILKIVDEPPSHP